MFKWKVSFTEDINNAKKMMMRSLPLDIMKLNSVDLNKQFTIHVQEVSQVTYKAQLYSTRELIFKFYETDSCKILHLTGKPSVHAISELLSELPPVYIFHAELSLTDERFTDLSSLNVLNAVYAISNNNYGSLFYYNLEKVIEKGLQFYWIE